MSLALASRRAAISPAWVKNPLWRTARAVPSLDLPFADTKSLTDAVTGQSLVTFTRASSGTSVGSDGVLRTAAVNEPRFDHNPTTGESLGLLVEEQRTNLLTYSEQIDNAIWTKTGQLAFGSGSIINDGVAPDGTTTADKLVEDTTTGGHNVGYSNVTTSTTTTSTISFFIKAAGRTALHVRYGVQSTVNRAQADINLSTGNVSNIQNTGTATGATCTATVLPGGWYRIVVSVNPNDSASTQMRLILYPNGPTSYTGDGTSGIYIWGAQLEAGAFPTSYIPTTTATVTRSADVASISGSNFSSWYRQDEGALFLDAASAQSVAAANVGAAINDGTLNNRIELNVRAGSLGGAGRVTFTSGGAVSFDTGNSVSPAFAVNTFYKQGTSYKLDSFAYSLNGGVAQTDASGGVPTAPDRMEIGARLVSGLPLNGTIRRLAYWGQRLPNNVLQAITQ